MYSTEDINYVEKILLPAGKHFTLEHINFIQHSTSASIQASPGSGKTTSLLAKLLLIDKYLQNNNDGVLVLSHTNAAVDEIKKRIGTHCTKIFAYPNFIGTVQEFTDKFLGIPGYQELFKREVSSVDTDVAEAIIRKEFYDLDLTHRNNLYRRSMLTSAERNIPEFINKHTKVDLASIGSERIRFLTNKGVCIAQDPAKVGHEVLMATKYYVLKEGYCTFVDMYQLAFRYMENHPTIKELISKRFPRVFIDEMQDMNEDQHKLVRLLFEGESSSIIQCIGDINQSIYHDNSQNSLWQPHGESLVINGTMRLSSPVSSAVFPLGVTPQQLVSLNSLSTLKPKLLIFDDTSLNKVVSTFSNYIRQHGLDMIALQTQNPIKIVGWVGTNRENNSELTLPSYYPNYQKTSSLKKDYYDKIDEYLSLIDIDLFKVKGGKLISDSLYSSLGKLFYTAKFEPEIRPYTASKVRKYMLNEHPMTNNLIREKVLICCQHLAKGQSNLAVQLWRAFVVNDICKLLEINTITPAVSAYLTPVVSATRQLPATEELPTVGNFYQHLLSDADAMPLAIEVASVHSVKGQTHTATLYVETYFNRKHDSDRVLDILLGNRPTSLLADTQKNMKMAYVGMTRATHFVCFAIHRDRITQNQLNLLSEKWDFEYISNS